MLNALYFLKYKLFQNSKDGQRLLLLLKQEMFEKVVFFFFLTFELFRKFISQKLDVGKTD